MLVLSIESSTSAAKAMLFDTELGIVAVETEPYAIQMNHDGVQNTVAVFQTTMRVGRKLARGKEIAAVAVCGIWHSIVVLNGKMEPVTDTFSWEYRGTSDICRRIRADEALTAELYNRTGCMPHATYGRHVLTLLKEQGMRLDDKLFASQGAYNFYRLTGKLLESRSTASGSGLLNVHTKEYDPFVLEMAGIKPCQLGELVSYREIQPLDEEGAALLGIAPGIPVVPAHPDGALNQIGSGAAQVGRMTLSVGTSAAMRLTAKQPVLPDQHQTWCYVGVEGWISGAAISGACNCINWFKNTYLQDRWSFSELEKSGDIGGDVPVFLPFLYGERCPGWRDNRSGGFEMLRPGHTVRDLYRAVQEGVCFNILQCYHALCRAVRIPKVILVSGGILNSGQWTQMLADIFQEEMICEQTTQASALGGAALAAYAAGALQDIGAFSYAPDKKVPVSPQKELAGYYAGQYERYCRWYEKTK